MKYALIYLSAFWPSLLFANAYVCNFEYFPKIERKIKDKVGVRELWVLPDITCANDTGATFEKQIGDFLIHISCQENDVSINVSREEVSFLTKTIERSQFRTPIYHSYISKNLSALRLSCVWQEVSVAIKTN